MKQSELKHWKWSPAGKDTEHYRWRETTMWCSTQSGKMLYLKTDDDECAELTAEALTEAARIAEHYEQTGRFGPDEETTSRKQRESWFRRQGAWQLLGPDTGAGVYEHAPTGARVWSGDSSKAVLAIALLEQRPEAEIVREMLEL